MSSWPTRRQWEIDDWPRLLQRKARCQMTRRCAAVRTSCQSVPSAVMKKDASVRAGERARSIEMPAAASLTITLRSMLAVESPVVGETEMPSPPLCSTRTPSITAKPSAPWRFPASVVANDRIQNHDLASVHVVPDAGRIHVRDDTVLDPQRCAAREMRGRRAITQ